jgi:polyphosphate kinase 2 (PPK2 family)
VPFQPVAPRPFRHRRKLDPSCKGDHESEEAARQETEHYRVKLAHQQALLYAQRKHSVLVVLQALDAGGKDGTVNHVFSALNPQGTTVVGFKQPTPVELAHDFLWRVHPRVPGRGEVAIFNRSHYEDVLRAVRSIASSRGSSPSRLRNAELSSAVYEQRSSAELNRSLRRHTA